MPRTTNDREKSKHWCFTINNPREGYAIYDPHIMQYMILGQERGLRTGTPHYQGYVCFDIRKRLAGVKKVFPHAHLERMRGTVEQAVEYCKKEGNYREHGVKPKCANTMLQEKWDQAYYNARLGHFDAIPKGMLIRNYHALKRVEQDNPIRPNTLPTRDNVWIVAPSGYGKSTYARRHYPDFYDKAPNKWFVGYKGEETVLCDDFGPKQCEYLGWYIKRWADVFPFPMETKGGGKLIRPKHIIVTSQYTIGECFFDILTREAIENRFTVLELRKWQERDLITDEVLLEFADTPILTDRDEWQFEEPRDVMNID